MYLGQILCTTLRYYSWLVTMFSKYTMYCTDELYKDSHITHGII